jgi:hypothetical protein
MSRFTASQRCPVPIKCGFPKTATSTTASGTTSVLLGTTVNRFPRSDVIDERIMQAWNLNWQKFGGRLEYDKLREYVFAGKRDQLWNVIPASIQTPQELQAFTERLQRNLNSRDRWIRYFSERTLAALIGGQQ